jgi:hypothetical protein
MFNRPCYHRYNVLGNIMILFFKTNYRFSIWNWLVSKWIDESLKLEEWLKLAGKKCLFGGHT